VKFSLDGCFEKRIVETLKMNRKGLEEIRKRNKPKYGPARRA
jgi:hypothetical protein